jgi:alpha-mannosidase
MPGQERDMKRFLFLLMWLAPAASWAADTDTCLVLSAENIVTGSGNWYLYVEISDRPCTIQPGDCLEYDIYLPALNPALQGGVDADLKGDPGAPGPPALAKHPWLRACGLNDQNGIPLHGDGTLTPAREQWYHRRFDLSPVAGGTVERWNAVFEGDRPGRYVQFLDNLRVTRDGQTVFAVYENGPAPEIRIRLNEGYSREVLVTTAPHDGTLDDKAVAEILTRARLENDLRAARDHFHAELDVARRLLDTTGDVPPKLAQAAAQEDIGAYDARNAEAYGQSLARAHEKLTRLEPELRRYTGHLVGHAHIDLQWLWSWDETVKQIIPDTFGQAVKFMDEYPGFTFSQSSAALYLATEEQHPELLKQIQEFAKKGQWEPVGGRWCEGDLNMISPESHVRHFLYAQRYFQQKFGRICTDGFEPDTFGHPWTMPQILRQAGLRSYYFCRGGSGRPGRQGGPPLFWWEGPDGSRVLAFDEAALDSWYIGSVTDDRVRKLAEFAEKTGTRDYLMVYGVGNHGGGPTRENIEAALAMKDRRPWPQIKFSTLGGFFDRLYEQVDQLKIPTVREELNPVFEGCYTSHGRVKKYNRDCESRLGSAETWAALLSLRGQAYPREKLQGLWRDLLWNHHHDTLCGSFVHASAEYSEKMYDRLFHAADRIAVDSRCTLIKLVTPPEPGAAGGPAETLDQRVIIFNSLAWARSEVVDASFEVPQSAVMVTLLDDEGAVPTQYLSEFPAQWPRLWGEPAHTVRVCFLARNVPGCGFKTFRAHPQREWPEPPPPNPNRDRQGADIQPRFQILHEKPHDMSAWEIGEIDRVTDLGEPVEVRTEEEGALRCRVSATYMYGESTILHIATRYPGTGRAEFEAIIKWNEVGSPGTGSDMLKVAFATGIQAESATYDIPFADVRRKNDGHENVALKWCDLSSTERGVTLLNDCKHGYDVKDGVIRLTLLRSSYEPDPRPDVGEHRMRYAVITHDGPLDRGAAARAAWEFNYPLRVMQISRSEPVSESDAGCTAPDTRPFPATWSACQAEPSNIIVTCLKLAEDDDDFILRAYECAGKRTTATFALGFDVRDVTDTDLLERATPDVGRVTVAGRRLTAELKPYEIRTFRLGR